MSTPEDIIELTAKAAIPSVDMECPACKHEFSALRTAIFQKNTMTMAYKLNEGHMLQASTLGQSMNYTAKFMKEVAKDMGIKIDVLISGLRYLEGEIQVDFLSVQVGKNGKELPPSREQQ